MGPMDSCRWGADGLVKSMVKTADGLDDVPSRAACPDD